MKAITGFLVGALMLVASGANAQYYAQTSVSGYVLSEGPLGFMLQGPDGNYGIMVNQATIITDPWNSVAVSGSGNLQPGDFVTATGYPTSQWIMRATQIVDRNAGTPVVYPNYGGYYGPASGSGIIFTPDLFSRIRQSVSGVSTFPRVFNTINP